MRWFLPFLLISSLLFADEEVAKHTKRIYSHLTIHDPSSAIREANEALSLFPDATELKRALIASLSEKGDEVEAFHVWKGLSKEEKQNPALLENLAWGVLRRADHSPQLLIQLYALIGSALTRDARALPQIQRALRGTNATLRTVAVRLSTSMRDALLQDELIRMLKEEESWHVRIEVIRAVGQLQMRSAKEALKAIAASAQATPEEKQAAITALVHLFDYATHEEVTQLIKSPYSGLRELGCEIVSYFEMREEAKNIACLLADASPSVRIAAINCLALLRCTEFVEKIRPHVSDAAFEVAITAAWALALFDQEEGRSALKKWLAHPHPPARRLAAGAIAALGPRGVTLAAAALKECDDPYMHITLARGLIGQRQHVKKASSIVFNALNGESKELWMWESGRNPLFRHLAPSTLWHTEELANYPYLMDQLIRLDLLSTLSFVKHPNALDAVKQFLKHQRSHVVGAAATVLLEVGDEEALVLVRALLQSKEEKIRLQAALTIALFGKDREAIDVLQELYLGLDHEEKLQVLEALSQIGDPVSIPFFIDRLSDPHQTLRVAAASALMQALYH